MADEFEPKEVIDNYKEHSLHENYDPQCSECYKEEHPPCVLCGGSGMLEVEEAVYPNEPHRAFLGSRVCDCQIKEEDDFSDSSLGEQYYD